MVRARARNAARIGPRFTEQVIAAFEPVDASTTVDAVTDQHLIAKAADDSDFERLTVDLTSR